MRILNFNFNPITPVRITSRFGKRNTGIRGASTFHKGIDLGRDFSKIKTNCILTNDAKCIENSWNDYRGWYVVFQIDKTYSVLYQHLATKSNAVEGKTYPAGTIIGEMGNSSNRNKLCVAVHLHFELHENGVEINPEPFLDNLEEYEMVTETKVIVDGKTKKVKRILKDGENFVRLRDMDDVLDVCKVEYDADKKLPVINRVM